LNLSNKIQIHMDTELPLTLAHVLIKSDATAFAQQSWPIMTHGAHIKYRDWLRREQCSTVIGQSLLLLHVMNGSLTKRQQTT